ncbi:MAG: His/Gly/Thr/Pro-type tRNA ligase C-terminal domain-containing protein, partial [Candidatus Nanohaloarchaea archaeon]|nr:His/Gly/Thr/Pro-type tRNA ligase C-terminal domain-containing protein [Candidatus Nanohaloarchaea archaeon]
WDGYDRVKDEEVRLWPADEQERGSPVSMTLEAAVESGEVSSEGYAWCLHLAWKLFRSVGIPADRMRFREHQADEKAHYATDAWDLEVRLDSFGWTECCGVHDRGAYDLAQHTEHSPQDLSFKDNHGEAVTPHILEIAFGTDRPTFALLDIFFDAEEERLELPPHVAPVDVAVFPLMSKDGMPEIADEVYRQLHERRLDVEYDESGSIGKRYARQDAKGTALCVTVDYDTKEDDTVTLRERDTADQVRVPIAELGEAVRNYLYADADLDDLGEPVE